METAFISKKIESIEYELSNLKTMIYEKKKGKVVSLKGLLQDLKVKEDDIKEAEKSLFTQS